MSVNEPPVAYRRVLAGSDRSFGLTFAVVFALIGLWPMVHGASLRYWAIAVAMVFFVAGLFWPGLLSPPKRVWFRLSLALHRVVNPVLMFLIYYGVIVPIGLVLRALGKDLLRLRNDHSAPSYWLAREPPGPADGSMAKQF
jgi:hypothetical protein